jgi:hypothetical protein
MLGLGLMETRATYNRTDRILANSYIVLRPLTANKMVSSGLYLLTRWTGVYLPSSSTTLGQWQERPVSASRMWTQEGKSSDRLLTRPNPPFR